MKRNCATSDIGLKRGSVQVKGYSDSWAIFGEQECRLIAGITGVEIDLVQHVGSTSVPGLVAKPIIDLVLGTEDVGSITELNNRLEEIGYIYRGDARESGGHLWVKESSSDVRMVHLHVVAIDSEQWNNYLKLRQLLRSDENARAKYAALKHELAHKFPQDRKAYTDGKAAFIRDLLRS